MTRYNPNNERMKRDYFRRLGQAKGMSEATIDGIRKSLRRFEEHTDLKDFSTFHREQAIAFKQRLAETRAEQSGKPLSKATQLTTLRHLRDFFIWLGQQPGYKSKIHIPDSDYFNLTDKETRAAKAPKRQEFPTLEQIWRVISMMPHGTEIEKRNRALIAFTILTGIRVAAIVSLKLKHVDMMEGLVHQDPREVDTKFSKDIYTWFFPLRDDLLAIVKEWVCFLQEEKLYGFDAPLFPRTALVQDANRSFAASGLTPEHWATTEPVRRIFRDAFAAAGLKYYHPHSFRHTLGHLQQKYCRNYEEMIAWSQNLGHESPVITYMSYGQISPHRQGEVLKGLDVI